VKALSLWQPWASLMADGLKTMETRGWRTPYLGPLCIHAAKRPLTRIEKALMYEWSCKGLLPASWVDYELPLGAIVAVVNLKGCIHTELCTRNMEREGEFGNYAPGRWAWLTTGLYKLETPLPCRGAQGLWELPIYDFGPDCPYKEYRS